jgi:glycosyltransferase involved in cell wall biosynthesis
VGIKTFYRTEKLKKTLDALLNKGFYEVIVADDSKIESEKEAFYNTYKDLLPLNVLKLPFDTGLSYGRNRIVETCKTEYLLMLDDDQVIPENIHLLLFALQGNEKLGGISCYWWEDEKFVCKATNIFKTKNYIIKDIGEIPVLKSTKSIDYYLCDFIPNSTLYRMDCFQSILWEEKIKIGSEHIDFYLNHKLNSDWQFAVTPDVIIKHYPNRASSTKGVYLKFRHQQDRLIQSKKILFDKWKVKGLLNGIPIFPLNKKSWKADFLHRNVVRGKLDDLTLSILASLSN